MARRGKSRQGITGGIRKVPPVLIREKVSAAAVVSRLNQT
jgi:hypothetical protein